MMKDYFRTLTKRVVTKVADSGGSVASETLTDSSVEGFIGVLNGQEIIKNKQLGNNATARLLSSTSFNITDRVVDTYGYFSIAGTVYEIVWVYVNQFEDNYYDLVQVQ